MRAVETEVTAVSNGAEPEEKPIPGVGYPSAYKQCESCQGYADDCFPIDCKPGERCRFFKVSLRVVRSEPAKVTT